VKLMGYYDTYFLSHCLCWIFTETPCLTALAHRI